MSCFWFSVFALLLLTGGFFFDGLAVLLILTFLLLYICGYDLFLVGNAFKHFLCY